MSLPPYIRGAMNPSPQSEPYPNTKGNPPGASSTTAAEAGGLAAEIDLGLVRRMAAGDEQALSAFYGRWFPIVNALITRILKSADDVEDVVEETFWQTWRQANRFAAEHVNLQTADDKAVLAKLVHAGAVFVGPYSPIAAGDYIAGPSHCLPTNTTARFSSGISVYEFLKRASVVKYEAQGLAADAAGIIALAEAEHLGGHAASVRVRGV